MGVAGVVFEDVGGSGPCHAGEACGTGVEGVEEVGGGAEVESIHVCFVRCVGCVIAVTSSFVMCAT